MRKFLFSKVAVAVALGSTFIAGQTLAQGYQVDEQSAKRLGDAFSGGAAEAEDASTVFYNPAGLVRIQKRQVVANVSGIIADAEFEGSSITPTSPTTVGSISGSAADASSTALVPTVYMAVPVNEDFVFGLSLTAPYATGTEFDSDNIGRYMATESSITGINFGYGFGARLMPSLSIGMTLNMQYVSAVNEAAINLSGACSGLMGTATCAGLGVTAAPGSSTQDGLFRMEGNDVAYGYTLGLLWEPTNSTRFGMNYRSEIRHNLGGDATVTVPAGTELVAGGAGITAGKYQGFLKLITPEALSLSVHQQITDGWSVQGDATYTRWSRFKSMDITSTESAMVDSINKPQNWQDNVRIAVGSNFDLSQAWTLRTGIAYDPSPIKDEDATLDFAFDDYIALSVGASWTPMEDLSIDAGLQHTLKQERDIDQGDLTEDFAVLKGSVTNNVTSIAAGINYSF